MCRNFKSTDLPLKLLERNSHEEGDSRSTEDLFDRDQQRTAPCIACRERFLITEPLQRRDGPAAFFVHRDFAMHFKIVHTGRPRSP